MMTNTSYRETVLSGVAGFYSLSKFWGAKQLCKIFVRSVRVSGSEVAASGSAVAVVLGTTEPCWSG